MGRDSTKPRPDGILARNASTSLARREVLSPRRDGFGPGPPKGIVQLEGEDAESEMLTVVLAPQLEPLTPVAHGPCVAIVEWGNGSGTSIAEVDFAKGTAIQVGGSFLSVAGRNDGALPDGSADGPDGQPTTIDPTPGDQAVVVVVSGYGPRPPGRVTRTFYGRSLAPGEERTLPVPNFARSFLIGRLPVAGTTIEAIVGDAPEPPLRPREGPFAFVGAPAVPISLYPFASGVTIRNSGATPVEAFQVVFDLVL
jgi:hypothetical protein